MNILVADDSTDFRDMLAEILSSHNYAVRKAQNGSQVMDILERNPVDLLITDIMMPDKSGFEIIPEVRAGFSGVSIIAVSGGGLCRNMEVLAAAMRLGADYVLAKPVMPEDILMYIKALAAR